MSAVPAAVLRAPISDLRLQEFTEKTLYRLGARTIGVLLARHESDLWCNSLLQREGIDTIKQALRDMGLKMLKDDDPDYWGMVSIDKLQLTPRTRDYLLWYGIKTVRQLLSLSEAELVQIKFIGYGRVYGIRKKLESLGLSLAKR